MPTFECKDIGMDCKFKASAKTETELLTKIADHAAKVHDMKIVPPDMMQKIKKVIKK